MKNKYWFLLLCCYANIAIAQTGFEFNDNVNDTTPPAPIDHWIIPMILLALLFSLMTYLKYQKTKQL